MTLSSVTNSAIQSFKSCNKAFDFRYIKRLRVDRPKEVLSDGATFHKALEVYDLTLGSHDAKKAAGLKAITDERSTFPKWCITDEDRWQWACAGYKIGALFICHADRYRNDDFEVVHTEFEFEVPIRNPETGAASPIYTMRGKIDRIVRLPDNRLAVQEYKTTSDEIGPLSDYWKRLRIDSQISTYILAARAMGIAVDTVIYDVSRKPALRPLEATPMENRKYRKSDGALYENQRERNESPKEFGARVYNALLDEPEKYFQREEIARLSSDLREHQYDVWAVKDQIRHAENTGRFPRNTGACKSWFGKCEYFDICTGCGWKPGEPVPEGFAIEDSEHPELTSTAPTT